jgi:hypothetical protein
VNNEGVQVLFAAITAKYGPFELTQEEIEDVETGIKVWMDEIKNTLHVESWNQDESEIQASE